MAKSLKKWIDELIDALGVAEKPTYPQIRSRLVKFSALAEQLEQGKAVRKAESKVAALEKQNLRIKSENENLKSKLQAANAEIDRFREEEKKREEENRDLPDVQFKILKLLPSESEGLAKAVDIAENLKIEIGDVDAHLSRLSGLGYAARSHSPVYGLLWHRTNKGNEHVMAKRLAGEDTDNRKRNYPNLPEMEEMVLVAVAKGPKDGITVATIVTVLNKAMPTLGKPFVTEGLVTLLLIKLREKNMATDGDASDYGTPRKWYMLRDGMEYLAERGWL
jgi:DNA-binding MarR family transcriptional regulator